MVVVQIVLRKPRVILILNTKFTDILYKKEKNWLQLLQSKLGTNWIVLKISLTPPRNFFKFSFLLRQEKKEEEEEERDDHQSCPIRTFWKIPINEGD